MNVHSAATAAPTTIPAPGQGGDYRDANEQMLVCALLEDVAVLENLDAILAVPGIDLYSIGPKTSRRASVIPASWTIRRS